MITLRPLGASDLMAGSLNVVGSLHDKIRKADPDETASEWGDAKSYSTFYADDKGSVWEE